MKISKILILSLFVFLWTSKILFVQANQKSEVPKPISENCLLTNSWTIDFCPKHWNEVSLLNVKLYQKWYDAEQKWVITLLDTINWSITKFRSKDQVLIKNTLNWYPLFALEYEEYIHNLFYTYVKENSDESNIVASFFKTTYFNQDQSGLWISWIKIYKWIPKQYDDWILLQVSIRNYTPNPISNIEDLYCFSTINNQDYIYPIWIRTPFKENTITNLIIELKAWISPLLEQIWEKKIACTLVYSQFWQTKYTNRGKLSFLMKQE